MFLTYVILSIVNVVLQTVKSIMTIKCGKLAAAIMNAVAFGVYTVVLIYTMCDFPLWEKVLVTAAINFVAVFIVKLVEEKLQKDKLWKIEATIQEKELNAMRAECEEKDLSYNYIDIKNYVIFNFYCKTQAESREVKELLKNYNAKYFVSEAKVQSL